MENMDTMNTLAIVISILSLIVSIIVTCIYKLQLKIAKEAKDIAGEAKDIAGEANSISHKLLEKELESHFPLIYLSIPYSNRVHKKYYTDYEEHRDEDIKFALENRSPDKIFNLNAKIRVDIFSPSEEEVASELYLLQYSQGLGQGDYLEESFGSLNHYIGEFVQSEKSSYKISFTSKIEYRTEKFNTYSFSNKSEMIDLDSLFGVEYNRVDLTTGNIEFTHWEGIG